MKFIQETVACGIELVTAGALSLAFHSLASRAFLLNCVACLFPGAPLVVRATRLPL